MRRSLTSQAKIAGCGHQPAAKMIQDVKNDWGLQSNYPFGIWTQIPTIQNVTEFDPSKSQFRDGAWVAPFQID